MTLDVYRYSFPALGTVCEFHLHASDEAAADRAARAAETEVFRIERRYSRYHEDSVLSAINRVAESGGTIEVDEETAGLLDYARSCHRMSGGLFDITSGVLRAAWPFTDGRMPTQELIDALLPRIGFDKLEWRPSRLTFSRPGMALDFGGIGKEYAADRAAAACVASGIRHGLVDLGGDIHVIGPRPGGEPWRIGIRDPRQPGATIATVSLGGGGLATSGDYERFIEIDGRRYGHILDPRTGWPIRGLSSVSVVADRCLVAGSVATIAMLKGRDGVAWLESLGVAHLWIDDADGRGGPLSGFPVTPGC
jgi:thiamine biosynthesis lipoprotein